MKTLTGVKVYIIILFLCFKACSVKHEDNKKNPLENSDNTKVENCVYKLHIDEDVIVNCFLMDAKSSLNGVGFGLEFFLLTKTIPDMKDKKIDLEFKEKDKEGKYIKWRLKQYKEIQLESINLTIINLVEEVGNHTVAPVSSNEMLHLDNLVKDINMYNNVLKCLNVNQENDNPKLEEFQKDIYNKIYGKNK